MDDSVQLRLYRTRDSLVGCGTDAHDPVTYGAIIGHRSPRNQASRAAGASTTNQIEQSVDNISAVQSPGGSRIESENFADKSKESFKRHRIAFLVDLAAVALSYGR